MERLDLLARDGLPDALRILLETHPRGSWEGHAHFDGLLKFWLDRHLMFRRMIALLRTDAEAVADDAATLETHAPRIAKLGSMFLQELHMHHNIEDHHYFPRLIGLDPRLARGFEMLDADHHALDALMARFSTDTNAALAGASAGPMAETHADFEKFMERHLTDEEDLIVPVLLEHGPLSE